MNKKRLLTFLLILLQILVLGCIIFQGARPTTQDRITISRDQMALQYRENGELLQFEGVSALAGGEECSELKLLSEEFELRKGVYHVTTTYSSSTNPGDQAFFHASVLSAQTKDYVQSESIRLYNQLPNPYFRIYVKENNRAYFQILRDEDCRDAISIESVNLVYSSTMTILSSLIKWIVWFLLFDALLLVLVNRISVLTWLRTGQNGVVVLGLAVLLLLAEFPMTVSYMINGYDLHYHVYRIQATASALARGVFPVKIQPEYMYGMGYADGTFYGSLFLMIPVTLYAIGFKIRTAYGVYVLFINLLTVLLGYYSFKKISKNAYHALAATAIWTMSMHRLVALYNRGASGVAGAMAFLPLLIVSIYMIYHARKEKKDATGWILLTISMTGILQFHTLTALLTTILLVLFALILYKWTFKPEIITPIIKAIVAFIMANLYYIVPFIDAYFSNELKVSDQQWKNASWQFRHWTVYIPQMFSSTYQSSYDILLDQDTMYQEMPLTLGIGSFLLLVLCIAFFLLKQTKPESTKDLLDYRIFHILFGFIVGSCFLSSNLFPYLWLEEKALPIYNFLQNFQYPWRFLAVGCCLLPFLFLFLIKQASTHFKQQVISVAIIVVTVLYMWQGIKFIEEYDHEMPAFTYEDSFRGATALAVSYGEYIPLNFDKWTIPEILGRVRSSHEGAASQMLTYDTLKCVFEVDNQTDETITISCPMLYYKGYTAKDIDQTKTHFQVQKDETGTVGVQIPTGYSGKVMVSYEEPWYWRLSEVLSLLCVISFIAYFLLKKKKDTRIA